MHVAQSGVNRNKQPQEYLLNTLPRLFSVNEGRLRTERNGSVVNRTHNAAERLQKAEVKMIKRLYTVVPEVGSNLNK